MKLSIVVPALNEAGQIESTLRAAAPARAAGHEVVVVDGGSSDETTTRAAPLADRVLTAPPGRGAQMNAGARAACGQALVFVHADTRLPPDAHTCIVRALGAGADWGRFDVCLDGAGWALRVIERAINVRSRVSGIATGDQAIFVRRAVFETVGGFPDQPLMEDVALSTQLKRSSRPACLRVPVLTSSRRWERDGVMPTVWLMWRLRAAYALGADPHALARRYRRHDRA